MAILIKSADGKLVSKPTLESARTDLDCADKTIIVTSELTEAQSALNAAWPIDRTLKVENGGIINVATGAIFTINGPFEAGLYQVFKGDGEVRFGDKWYYPSGGIQGIPVQWFGAVSDYSGGATGTDNTNAVQKAVNSKYRSGYPIIINGSIKCGAITFPASPTIIEIWGRLKLTATWDLTGFTSIIGRSASYYNGGVARGQIESPNTTMTTLRVLGNGGTNLENLHISYCKGIGIELVGTKYNGVDYGGANCTIKRCSVVAASANLDSPTGYPEAVPLHVRNWFWFWAEDLELWGNTDDITGVASDHSAIFEQTQTDEGAGYLGICDWRQGLIYYKGIKVSALSTTPPHKVALYFHFGSIQYESGKNEMWTFAQYNSGILSGITVDNCSSWDTAMLPYYGVNVIGKVWNVNFINMDQNEITFTPGGGTINGLYTQGYRRLSSTAGFAPPPVYTQDYTRVYNSSVDAKLPNQALQPTVLPVAPENVNQDPGAWVALNSVKQATITGGILAPDGTYTAGRVTGDTGASARFWQRSGMTLTAGDWFIYGGWMKATGLRGTDSLFLICTDTAVRFNDGNANYAPSLGAYDIQTQVDDGTWHFVIRAAKITTGASGAIMQFFGVLDRPTGDNGTEYWNPGVIYIPASAGFSDYEVVRLSRNLNTIPTKGTKGAMAINHSVSLLGGARLLSYTPPTPASATPPISGVYTTGIDRVLNASAVIGQPKGWICTTSGALHSGTRANSTNYVTGTWRLFTGGTGTTVWECTTAGFGGYLGGTSGGSEPSIAGAVVGTTVADNNLVWTCRSLTVATLTSEGNL